MRYLHSQTKWTLIVTKLKKLNGNVLYDKNSVGFKSMRYMGTVDLIIFVKINLVIYGMLLLRRARWV